jgi:hypothetical protein
MMNDRPEIFQVVYSEMKKRRGRWKERNGRNIAFLEVQSSDD